MHVDFESSGGYANIKLKYNGNTDELPEETANKLIQLVKSSGIFDLKENEITPSISGPPDVLYYKLTIYEDNKRISLSFNEVTAPGSLRSLLSFLRKLAMDEAVKGKYNI